MTLNLNPNLNLTQFSGGTENYYRHPLNPKIVFTDGVHYVATEAQAFWLLDKIATLQSLPKLKSQPFQVWELTKQSPESSRAVITVTDGDDNRIYQENLTFTDFPDPHITIWFTNNTILLPCEY